MVGLELGEIAMVTATQAGESGASDTRSSTDWDWNAKGTYDKIYVV